MADIARIIARMQSQISELQRRQNNTIRSGRVVAVDAANQRVKVDVGDTDNPMHSPWVRWPERAGARKTWNPPSVGELMTVLSPSGEIDAKSLAVHGGYTNDNPSPSADPDATVYTLGPLTVTILGDGATLSVGGTVFEFTAGGFATTGGRITHNGVDIGDTHVHGGIAVGTNKTTVPE